jgi:AcrR family transcriptional regulator
MAARRKAERVRDPGEVRERILREFSARAARSGIRSVVMAEFASELRMSATTLYNHFPSKHELVIALVERWAADLAASEAAAAEISTSRSATDGLAHWAEAWASSVARYSPAFWEDLRRDHAEAWAIFQQEIRRRKRQGAAVLRPFLHPDVHPEMALALLDRGLMLASDPEQCERIGVSRAEAIRTAVRIWAQGALQKQGKLAPFGGAPKGRVPTRRGPAESS